MKTFRPLVLLALLASLAACRSVTPAENRVEPSLPARHRTFACGELDISYMEIGRGSRVLLFVHGFGASSRNWADVAARFDPELYRLLLLDLKGCGASPKPDDGRYSLRDQADIVVRLIQEERLEKVTLIGHSMGGGICLLVALRAGEWPFLAGRLEGLVLIDSAAYSTEVPFFIRYLQAPMVRMLISEMLPPRSQARFVLRRVFADPARITDEVVERYASGLRDPEARRAARDIAVQIVPDDHPDLVARFPTIELPTLVVWGSEDPVLPIADAHRLRQALPDCELAVIEGCGHVPPEEAPGETARLIAAFLDRER